jgi:complement component 1 Q subcomponent-binding protein
MSMLRTTVARSLRAVGSKSASASSGFAHTRQAVTPVWTSRHQQASAPSSIRHFHLSRPAFGSGESDSELSSRLEQEISYEKEAASGYSSENGTGGEPGFLTDFKKQGLWKIEDQAGSDEIALVREFGNEHIRILFSIGDIDTSEEDEDTPEDDEPRPFPVRCAITISKPNQGALTVDAQAVDGTFSIENISFYKDSKLATELTAEADWARRGLYIGPQVSRRRGCIEQLAANVFVSSFYICNQFETLDETVQAQFESFLEERGISTDLAMFVPNFAEYKEQRGEQSESWE